MDKGLIRRRFARAASSYQGRADVQRQVAQAMNEAIGRYVPEKRQRKVLEIGCGTGTFTRCYLKRTRPERLLLNDICPEVEPYFSDLMDGNTRFMACDAESLDFPDGQDLIVSCSAVQWFEHPERFLSGCRNLLVEQGYLAFSTFGPDNAREIASLTAATLPYRSLEELAGTLSREYRIVYSHEERLSLWFDSPMEVLRHLKETGVTGIRPGIWTKGSLAAFSERYQQLYARPDGKVSLTYHPIYMICKKL